jgi:serine/threonine-protein kinase
VRFDRSQAGTAHSVADLVRGAAPSLPRPSGDPEAARLIALLEAHDEDDHYALCGADPASDFRTIREKSRTLALQMLPRRFPKIDESQRQRLAALHNRVTRAEEVLLDRERRAAYDTARGNFAGVARCIAAGLPAEAIDRLHREHLKAHPDKQVASQAFAREAQECESRGDQDGALGALGRALQEDPLDVELQRRYWRLRRPRDGGRGSG